MRTGKVVQFVCFETTLDKGEFITRWDDYTRSANSDNHVTLQQSEKNGVFRYIAQHRCAVGDPQFVFTKAGRSSRTPQVGIRAKQAGGYSSIQEERSKDTQSGESKVFAFITDTRADIKLFKKLSAHAKLNIYEAYYENCQYAYILEYFVKTKNAAELVDLLKQNEAVEIGSFKEIALQSA
jgi:hypothetical protein